MDFLLVDSEIDIYLIAKFATIKNNKNQSRL